jgi:site-specific DNA recombinase
MKTNMKAVGYIRCSTDQQEDSPDQQKKAINDFAQSRGIEILEWYTDFGKSGTTFEERPEFQRLRVAVDAKPAFSTVICYDESRWGRAIDAEENAYWRVHFRKRGVDVLLVKTSVDPKHEFAPMLKAFEGVQASQYSKKLSELTMRGTMNNGEYSNGGFPPYGYCRKAINLKTGATRILHQGEWCTAGQEKVLWEPGDEQEQTVVRDIFAMRIKGLSFAAIAHTLNEKTVACPQRGHRQNLDGKWGSGSIKSILENPAYRGARVYNRNSMSKILADARGADKKPGVRYPHWLNEKEKWSVHENAHPAIVSKETWESANPEKPKNRDRQKPRHNVPYLLSGLMRCAKCGHHFQGQSTRIKQKEYYRYVCAGYNSKHTCSYTAVKRDHIEGAITAEIRQMLASPIFEEQILRRLEELLKQGPENLAADLRRIDDQTKDNLKAIERLTIALEKGAPVESTVKRMQELDRVQKGLDKQRDELQRQQARLVETTELRQKIREYVASWGTGYDGMPVEMKRSMIGRIVSAISVDKGSGMISVKFRALPTVDKALQELYANMEETKKAPDNQMPFRRTVVAGARTIWKHATLRYCMSFPFRERGITKWAFRAYFVQLENVAFSQNTP